MSDPNASTVVPFPTTAPIKKASSTERIWGKPVAGYGYTGVPSILIQAQSRLGVSPLQFNIIIQLLDYWREPERRPFPSKREIAARIGVNEKTIQTNIRALEKAGLIRRELRRTLAGDYDSNIYHPDGLVERVRALEPDFAKVRDAKAKLREARRSAETSPHRRAAQK